MSEITDVTLSNGDVTYFRAQEATPTTSETTGNVTINNVGSPGVPAYFEVAFRVQADVETDGRQSSLWFSPTVTLTGLERDTPYGEIEAAAARKLAPMFHAIADMLSQDVEEYDSQRAGEKSVTSAT